MPRAIFEVGPRHPFCITCGSMLIAPYDDVSVELSVNCFERSYLLYGDIGILSVRVFTVGRFCECRCNEPSELS